MRTSGILLPISALPTRYGIGGFSKEAYSFADMLARAGQKIWQILPVGPTGYGDSPYQSFSTFAGNPYFISLERLCEEGLLTAEECEEADCGQNPGYVEYERVYQTRYIVLRKAFARFDGDGNEGYQHFIAQNRDWLENHALFTAIKHDLEEKSWREWPEPLKRRDPEALEDARQKYLPEIRFYAFLQYLFYSQWHELKKYVNEKGIRILGDIPIYVAMDSADAWANPELFQFDADLVPAGVAGCPPDAFAVTGQLWGNPLYDWAYHKKTGFVWWVRRMQHMRELYDIIRIDHFRGFESYYSVPFGDPTAEHGHWEPGPGIEIFRTLEREVYAHAENPGDGIHLIAEDLGFLTEEVRELQRKSGYPGMKVLQFAFDGTGQNEYLPHFHRQNGVVYTGTHDNDTTKSWYSWLSDGEKLFICRYLSCGIGEDGQFAADPDAAVRPCDPDTFTERLIRAALGSVCDTAVIPMQDYLHLGHEARINEPSTLGGNNWKWRLLPGQFTEELADHIRALAQLYGR